MNNNINQVLRDLGFEEREIRIYLTLIKEQNLTALEISKKTGIDRTTIYDLLEKLIHKGIISSFIKNKTKNFKALIPKKLANHFKKKYSSLESILPELNNLTNKKNDPVKLDLFQGTNGLKTVLIELLKPGLEYKVIGIRKEYEDLLGFFIDQGTLEVNQLNIKETAIIEKGTEFTKTKHGKYKYLEKNSLPPTTTLIYKNTTVFLIWKEPYFAIRIENTDFTKTQKKYFDLLWQIAKK